MRKVKQDKVFWQAALPTAPSRLRRSDVTFGRSATLLYIAEFTRTICSLLLKRRRSVRRKQGAACAKRKSGLDGITDMGSHSDNIGHARWGRSPMIFQAGLHGGGASSASEYNACRPKSAENTLANRRFLVSIKTSRSLLAYSKTSSCWVWNIPASKPVRWGAHFVAYQRHRA